VIPVLITIGGLGLLMLAGVGSHLGRRVHPAHRARLLLGGLVSGVLLLEAGLTLWSAPVVLDLVGLIDLAEVCRRALGGPTPGGTTAGVASGLTAVWVAGAVVVGWWRVASTQRRLRIDASIMPVRDDEAFDLYVVSSPRRMAYTVGGRRPQVVITDAVVEAMPEGSVDVIMAHERVHALNNHHRFLAAIAAVEMAMGWVPPVRDALGSVRILLERWADEDAALTAAGGRSDVKRTLITACLATTPGAAGFGGVEMVSERIAGLNGPSPRRFSKWVTAAYVASTTLTVASFVLVAWTARLSVLVVISPGQCLV
jgi:beta-lactamase regulating signal transducer with metallopeptidase domain